MHASNEILYGQCLAVVVLALKERTHFLGEQQKTIYGPGDIDQVT